MYAYFKKLDYFSTECTYAPFAARGAARDFIKDLEVCAASCTQSSKRFSKVSQLAGQDEHCGESAREM